MIDNTPGYQIRKCIEKHGTWAYYPGYARSKWQREVANGETQRGYWSWVHAQLEQEEE